MNPYQYYSTYSSTEGHYSPYSFEYDYSQASMSGKGKEKAKEEQQYYDGAEEEEDEDPDAWKNVTDPNERRRIQNRLAQRKFRYKTKQRKEDQAREAQNQQAAGGAYASPDADHLEHGNATSGLPWGGVSMKHVVERGKAKEESRRTSREGSVYYGSSRRGDSSR